MLLIGFEENLFEERRVLKENNSFPIALSIELYNLEDSDNKCFLCNKPNYKLLYEISDYGFLFQFKKCQCGIVKQTPMPNNKFFDLFFNSDIFFSSKREKEKKIWGYYNYFSDEHLRYKTSKYRFKRFMNYKKPISIMKIGPGTGSFLGVAKENNHNVLGCDMSDRFIDFAKEHYKVDILKGRFEELDFENNRFDVILMFSVLENVNNIDELLKEVYRTLRPDGYFIFNFVDMKANIIAKIQKSKYFLFRPPVCYIFSMPILEKVLKKYNFRVIRVVKDIRYMSIEKLVSLLGWPWLLKIVNFLKINKISFPIYAYPSKIVVVQKKK